MFSVRGSECEHVADRFVLTGERQEQQNRTLSARSDKPNSVLEKEVVLMMFQAILFPIREGDGGQVYISQNPQITVLTLPGV